ncbi:MAG: hypothetical protein JWP20_2212, partial [Roseomonas sp.]|nr:hypothetical protein [Roseomonas sp.]
IENMFCRLTDWRRIAMRYGDARKPSSPPSASQLPRSSGSMCPEPSLAGMTASPPLHLLHTTLLGGLMVPTDTSHTVDELRALAAGGAVYATRRVGRAPTAPTAAPGRPTAPGALPSAAIRAMAIPTPWRCIPCAAPTAA